MKLEPNGNVISLNNSATKIATQGKEELIPDEFQEFQDDEAEVSLNNFSEQQSGEKEGVAGKKKGTRKKRSLNWEEAERGLLLEVVKPKVDYVENRMVDAKSIKAKRLSWMQITKHFNALNFRHRSLEQIQVQWRSMKNSAKREYQQKHAKSTPVDGMELIEFMEEMQKDPVSARSQTRGGGGSGGGGGVTNKKELLEIDDEDMPLAELPNSTNASEDTLQTSAIELPLSADSPMAEETHTEIPQATPTRGRKKPGPAASAQKPQASAVVGGKIKAKRQRNSLNHEQPDVTDLAVLAIANAADVAPVQQQSELLPLLANALNNATSPSTNCPVNGVVATASHSSSDEKYKKQLFELMKRTRLAEMDYTRREHEQKLRFEQMELDLKLNYYRQQEELKLRQMREDHEIRMRHCQAEHEARMRVYALKSTAKNTQVKLENSNNESNAAY